MTDVERRKREKTAQWRARRMQLIQQLKSGPYLDCGKTYPSICMDFDHVRGVKNFTISRRGDDCTLPMLLKELEKCDLVCSNCHRIRTQSRR